jgi:predicted DNA-binding protein
MGKRIGAELHNEYVGVRISPTTRTRLEALAAARGVRLSTVIREILESEGRAA